MVSTQAAASPFVLMETLSPSRNATFTSVVVLALVLVLYVGIYCWLRFGVARQVTVSPMSALWLANERWKGFDDRLNFIFKPLLKADALISRKEGVWFTGEDLEVF